MTSIQSRVLNTPSESDFYVEDNPVDLLLENTPKEMKVIKTIQFFLVTWIIGGGLFIHLKGVDSMFTNTSICVSIALVLSGFLTHLKFGGLLTNRTLPSAELEETVVCVPFWRRYELYLFLRVLVHSPVHILPFIYALIIDVIHDDIIWRDVIVNGTLSTSLFSMYPIYGSLDKYLMPSYPTAALMSTFLLCWLSYPIYNRFLEIARMRSRTPAIFNFLIFAFIIPLLFAKYIKPEQIKLSNDSNNQVLVYRDNKTLIGNASWYLNVLIRLPTFMAGVFTAEMFKYLDWAKKKDENTPPREDRNVIVKYILPLLVDCVIVAYVHLLFFDMRGVVISLTQSIGGMVWKYSGLQLIIPDYLAWTVSAWAAIIPPTCILLLAVGSPIASRSILVKAVTLDPIISILPGRTPMIMTVIYPLVFKSFSQEHQNQLKANFGQAYFITAIFLVSVPAYYYIYQPWHSWFLMKVLERYDTQREPSSQFITSDEMLRERNDARIRKYHLIHVSSPNYDPFYLNSDSKEIDMLKYLEETQVPRVVQIWSWVKRVFVNVHKL